MSAHPGFAKVQGKIEGEGYSKKVAGAILANASRHASASAKKKNPRLKKVGGAHAEIKEHMEKTRKGLRTY